MTANFPKHELFGLCSQMRRSAVSVPANIAEGFRRQSRPDKARVMNIAEASLEELKYYFILAKDLGYTETSSERATAEEIGKMLHAYIATVNSRRS